MVDIGDGRKVLSKDAIGILRKTKPGDYASHEKYLESLKGQFKKIFGTEVDDVYLEGMARYFNNVDSLSPPLFVRSRQGIDLSEAKNGLVSVDFTGVGVDNAYEAMVGLAKNPLVDGSKQTQVSRALAAVDGHVDNVTDSMNNSKVAFIKELKRSPEKGSQPCSQVMMECIFLIQSGPEPKNKN